MSIARTAPQASHHKANLRLLRVPSLATLPAPLMAAIAFFVFSSMDAILKGATEVLPLWVIYGLISFGATIAMLPFHRYMGGIQSLVKTPFRGLHTVRSICAVGNEFCFGFAISQLPITTTYTLFFGSPAVTAVLAWILLREHLPMKQIIAIVMGFAGVLTVLRPGVMPLEPPMLVAIMGMLLFSFAGLVVRRIGRRDVLLPSLMFPRLLMLVICGCLFFINKTTAQEVFVWGNAPIILMVILLGFGYALGAALFIQALSGSPANQVVPLQYSQLIWGTLFGWLFFDQLPDQWTIVGASLILASGVILILSGRRGISGIKDVLDVTTRVRMRRLKRIRRAHIAWLERAEYATRLIGADHADDDLEEGHSV